MGLATWTALLLLLVAAAPASAEEFCPGRVTQLLVVDTGEIATFPASCEVVIASGQSIIVEEGGQLNNLGEIAVDGFLEVLVGGVFVNDGNGHVRNRGVFRIRGRASATGDVTNYNEFVVTESGEFDTQGRIINHDTLTIQGDPVLGQGILESRGGVIVNQALLNINRGILDNRGGVIINRHGGSLGDRTASIVVFNEGFLQNRDDALFGEAIIHNFADLRSVGTAANPGGIANALGAEIINWSRTVGTIENPPALPGPGTFVNCPFAVVLDGTVEGGITQAASCSGTADLDGDGLRDVVDAEPGNAEPPPFASALAFNDAGIAMDLSFGSLQVVPVPDQEVVVTKNVTEEPARRDGIDIEAIAGSGADPVTIDGCGSATAVLDDGESMALACGSATLEVQVGPVDATFEADDGELFFASIASGHTLHFDPEIGTFTADASNPSAIVIVGEGGDFAVLPGDTVDAPVLAGIEVQPGSGAAPVNLRKRGVLPVVIYGADSLDVADIDFATLEFGPADATPVHAATPAVIEEHRQDVDSDGFDDLVSHYSIGESGIVAGAQIVCLSWQNLDGTAFAGCDDIGTVGR